MEQQTLLYEGTTRLPEEIWSKEDITKMINTITDSRSYSQSIWGAWMKARDKCILIMMYEHALRPAECLNLKQEDINLHNKTIKIHGCHNKVKKDRLLPINEKITPYFIDFFTFPKWMWKGSKYLFPSISIMINPLYPKPSFIVRWFCVTYYFIQEGSCNNDSAE